mmetsp:Transcript_21121/g.55612  ORF Transcript_21121/g.55612 Transcript_21121/m.55612 type:complete len:231 (-) Transcript_21121:513-1205(-)
MRCELHQPRQDRFVRSLGFARRVRKESRLHEDEVRLQLRHVRPLGLQEALPDRPRPQGGGPAWPDDEDVRARAVRLPGAGADAALVRPVGRQLRQVPLAGGDRRHSAARRGAVRAVDGIGRARGRRVHPSEERDPDVVDDVVRQLDVPARPARRASHRARRGRRAGAGEQLGVHPAAALPPVRAPGPPRLPVLPPPPRHDPGAGNDAARPARVHVLHVPLRRGGGRRHAV